MGRRKEARRYSRDGALHTRRRTEPPRRGTRSNPTVESAVEHSSSAGVLTAADTLSSRVAGEAGTPVILAIIISFICSRVIVINLDPEQLINGCEGSMFRKFNAFCAWKQPSFPLSFFQASYPRAALASCARERP